MIRALKVKEFPDYYITDAGTVYSRNHFPDYRIRKMAMQKHPQGYRQIQLRKDGKTVCMLVHRLVADAFIPNPENRLYINHKNGIRHDNRVGNLEWCTASENALHAYRTLGRECRSGWNKIRKPVWKIKNGIVMEKYISVRDASNNTGIKHQNISACCRGELKSAGGYEWKYDTRRTI